MLFYVILAALTAVLAKGVKVTEYSDNRQRVMNKLCIAAIFTVLTLVAALRVDVGNDYGNYVVTAHEIFQRGYVVTEPGFNLVVRVLYTLSGKEDHILMFAVFGAAIVAIFLKSMLDLSDSFFMSVCLFMTLGVYFRSFNTVRYYLVLAVTLYSLKYVVVIRKWVCDRSVANVGPAGVTAAGISAADKNNVGDYSPVIDIVGRKELLQAICKFLILIGVAATFHKSVLIVIPLYGLCIIPWKKWTVAVLAIMGAISLFLHNQIFELALKLYPSYRNTIYIETEHTILENWQVIARCVLVIVLAIYCGREALKDCEDNKLYLQMNILAVIIYVCGYYLPLITRVGYYLITSQLILIPNIIMSVSDKIKRRRIIAIVAVLVLCYFAYFLLTAGKVGVHVLPYHSWLFSGRRYLNQTDTF